MWQVYECSDPGGAALREWSCGFKTRENIDHQAVMVEPPALQEGCWNPRRTAGTVTSRWDDWRSDHTTAWAKAGTQASKAGQAGRLTRITGPPTDRNDEEVTGTTWARTEGLGMDLTDLDVDYGDRAGDSDPEWAATGRAEPAGRCGPRHGGSFDQS